MRISTRLALLLGATFAVIMLSYAGITLQQRVQLLRGALIAETETLAGTLRIVTDNALRDGRIRDLSRVFGEVVADPETVVAAVTDRRGGVVVGAAGGEAACLRLVVPRGPVGSGGARGWADCGMRVRWVVLPAAGSPTPPPNTRHRSRPRPPRNALSVTMRSVPASVSVSAMSAPRSSCTRCCRVIPA